METMETYEIVRTIRDLQDIDQKEVAVHLNLTPQAINRYEKGTSTLSREKLLAYATFINMNPQFIETQGGNPFRCEDIIKIYFPEHAATIVDYLPIDILASYNEFLQVMLLIEEKGPIGKLLKRTTIEKPAYAIAAWDRQNVYIMKRKAANIVGSLDLLAALNDIAITEDKEIRYFVQNIPRSLFQKIRRWDNLHRDDIMPLFVAVNRRRASLSEHPNGEACER